MTRTESPVSLAFWRLMDLARGDVFGETWLFALAWLAAGRMAIARNLTVDQLAEVDVWKDLVDALEHPPFGLGPMFEIVAVLVAAQAVEFVRQLLNLLLQRSLIRLYRLHRRRFLMGGCHCLTSLHEV